MKLRLLISSFIILIWSLSRVEMTAQTYQKLSTLERSAVPGMFPLTKTTSGQNIMVYSRFDTAVNGAIDTTVFVLYATFLDSLFAVSGRQTWLKPELEAGSVAINSAGGFQIDSLTILQFNSRRTGGTANARLLLSSTTSVPSRLLSFNPADTSELSELVLDFDGTSYFSAITAEIQARGGLAKLRVNDTIATVFGTLFLDKYQSPFNYLGSPAALLGVNGIGEVWAVDPGGFGNGIYSGSDTIPNGTVATIGFQEDDPAFGFYWNNGSRAITFSDTDGTGGDVIIWGRDNPTATFIRFGDGRLAFTSNENYFVAEDGGNASLTLWDSTGQDLTLTVPFLDVDGIELILPPGVGIAGQVLSTDGTGRMGWIDAGAGDGNGIYGGSGTVPTATGALCTNTFQITSGGGGLYMASATPVTLGTFNANRFQVNGTSNQYLFGDDIGTTTNATLILYNEQNRVLGVRPPAVLDGAGYTLVLPSNIGTAGQVLTSTGTATEWRGASYGEATKSGTLVSYTLSQATPTTLKNLTAGLNSSDWAVPTDSTMVFTGTTGVFLVNMGFAVLNSSADVTDGNAVSFYVYKNDVLQAKTDATAYKNGAAVPTWSDAESATLLSVATNDVIKVKMFRGTVSNSIQVGIGSINFVKI